MASQSNGVQPWWQIGTCTFFGDHTVANVDSVNCLKYSKELPNKKDGATISISNSALFKKALIEAKSYIDNVNNNGGSLIITDTPAPLDSVFLSEAWSEASKGHGIDDNVHDGKGGKVDDDHVDSESDYNDHSENPDDSDNYDEITDDEITGRPTTSDVEATGTNKSSRISLKLKSPTLLYHTKTISTTESLSLPSQQIISDTLVGDPTVTTVPNASVSNVSSVSSSSSQQVENNVSLGSLGSLASLNVQNLSTATTTVHCTKTNPSTLTKPSPNPPNHKRKMAERIGLMDEDSYSNEFENLATNKLRFVITGIKKTNNLNKLKMEKANQEISILHGENAKLLEVIHKMEQEKAEAKGRTTCNQCGEFVDTLVFCNRKCSEENSR